jgi:hypothetical protein
MPIGWQAEMGPKAIGFAFSVQVEIFPVRTIKFPAKPKKFPACLRREFGCKALKLPRDLMLFSEKLAWNEGIWTGDQSDKDCHLSHAVWSLSTCGLAGEATEKA